VLPSSNTELALREKQVDAGALGLIFLGKALERGGIRPLFTDHDLFGSFNAGSFVMSTKFIARNPNTARTFVRGVGRAIEWMRGRPREDVAARMESIIARRKRNEDGTAVKYWRSGGVATAQAALTDIDFQRWIDWLVKDGQLKPGQVKPQDIYTNEFQPQPTSMR
jgi:ABC-type nitrate/sulfonate/bicarbonate transport system substrate-binding protein